MLLLSGFYEPEYRFSASDLSNTKYWHHAVILVVFSLADSYQIYNCFHQKNTNNWSDREEGRHLCWSIFQFVFMETVQTANLVFDSVIVHWTFLGKYPMHLAVKTDRNGNGTWVPNPLLLKGHWLMMISPNNISVVRLSHIPLLKFSGTRELRMNTQDIFNAKKLSIN